MPVLARFCGIVIRMLMGPTIGMRLHAFHGDTEVVLGLNPVRVIQSDAPAWVVAEVLNWARGHEPEIRNSWCQPELAPMPLAAGSRAHFVARI